MRICLVSCTSVKPSGLTQESLDHRPGLPITQAISIIKVRRSSEGAERGLSMTNLNESPSRQIAFAHTARDGSGHSVVLIFEESIPAYLPGLAILNDQLVVLPKSPGARNTRYRNGTFEFETERGQIAGNWNLIIEGTQLRSADGPTSQVWSWEQIRQLPLGPANEYVNPHQQLRILKHVSHVSVSGQSVSANTGQRQEVSATSRPFERIAVEQPKDEISLSTWSFIGGLIGVILGATTTRLIQQSVPPEMMEVVPQIGLIFPFLAGGIGGLLGLGSGLLLEVFRSLSATNRNSNGTSGRPEVPDEPTSDVVPESHLGLSRDSSAIDFHSPTVIADPQQTVSWQEPAGASEVTPGAASLTTFGDFEILERIAAGGMGVVFKARQISLNRLVAIKFIRSAELVDQRDVRRFVQEAEHAAQLDHPGIVPVYEVGQHQGAPYFAMALVTGSSLKQVLEKDRLSSSRIAELLLQISHAVSYAHHKGIIHRDLKPANILLDSEGHPRVTDFGLAKRLGSQSSLTETGQIMGTPAYMPPEQARGDMAQTGPASDIYCLGAILYEMMTGRRPFEGPAHQVLQDVILRDPPAPSEIAPVSRDLEAICLKAMQKEISARYGTVEQMAQDLEHVLRDEPVSVRRYGWREKSLRVIRKRWRLLVTVASVLFAMGITWIARPQPQPLVSAPVAVLTSKQVLTKSMQVNQARVNLQGIGLAIHNYLDVHKYFPSRAICDANGRPLLSWRVAILPYLDQAALYKQFHLNEPWDSPHNLALLKFMPREFAPVGTEPSTGESTQTHIQAIVGPGTCFESDPRHRLRIQEITDGTSNTLLIAEAVQAVPWTSPQDFPLPDSGPLTGLGGVFEEGFHGLFANGEARFFRNSVLGEADQFRALLGRGDGQVVNLVAHEGFPEIPRSSDVDADVQKLADEMRKQNEDRLALLMERARATSSANNLKQLAQAILQYEKTERKLPSQNIRDIAGKPGLSWRVAILPYLDQQPLYRKFHLDEPWDSSHNLKLLPLMPEVFRVKDQQPATDHTTYYQVLVSERSPFPPDGSARRLTDVTDGLTNTLLIAESGRAVPWTQPEDLTFQTGQALPALGGLFPYGFQAVTCDSTVLHFTPEIADNETLMLGLSGIDEGTLLQADRLATRFEDAQPTPPSTDAIQVSGAVQSARQAAVRVRSRFNLKQLGSAMHQYQKRYGSFPPAAICDSQGKPLLSWRVALLPFLDQELLYRQFHLDEAWDSPHNSALLQHIPKVYADPRETSEVEAKTFYQVVTGTGTAFDLQRTSGALQRGIRSAEIRDGFAKTWMLAEAETAVLWTQPVDLRYEPPDVMPQLGGVFLEGFHAVTFDGNVKFFTSDSITSNEMKSLLLVDDDRLRTLNGPRQ